MPETPAKAPVRRTNTSKVSGAKSKVVRRFFYDYGQAEVTIPAGWTPFASDGLSVLAFKDA